MSKEQFTAQEAQEEIRKHAGEDFDATEEFSRIDISGVGEVRFDALMNWAFKRSLGMKKMKE